MKHIKTGHTAVPCSLIVKLLHKTRYSLQFKHLTLFVIISLALSHWTYSEERDFTLKGGVVIESDTPTGKSDQTIIFGFTAIGDPEDADSNILDFELGLDRETGELNQMRMNAGGGWIYSWGTTQFSFVDSENVGFNDNSDYAMIDAFKYEVLANLFGKSFNRSFELQAGIALGVMGNVVYYPTGGSESKDSFIAGRLKGVYTFGSGQVKNDLTIYQEPNDSHSVKNDLQLRWVAAEKHELFLIDRYRKFSNRTNPDTLEPVKYVKHYLVVGYGYHF